MAQPEIDSGYTCLFHSNTAPVGWTKVTSISDNAIVISSNFTSGSLNPGIGFSTAFANTDSIASPVDCSLTVPITVGATTITTAQLPAHTHGPLSILSPGNPTGIRPTTSAPSRNVAVSGSRTPIANGATGANGGGGSHTHSLTVGYENFYQRSLFKAKYVDVILATRD